MTYDQFCKKMSPVFFKKVGFHVHYDDYCGICGDIVDHKIFRAPTPFQFHEHAKSCWRSHYDLYLYENGFTK